MGTKVVPYPGLLMDVRGKWGDLVFQKNRAGELEAICKDRWEPPKYRERVPKFRKCYSQVERAWQRLDSEKREGWLEGWKGKGTCGKTLFMKMNLRRCMCDLPLMCTKPDRDLQTKGYSPPEHVGVHELAVKRFAGRKGWYDGCHDIDGVHSDFIMGDESGAYPGDPDYFDGTWFVYWERTPGVEVELMSYRFFMHTTRQFMIYQKGTDWAERPSSDAGEAIYIYDVDDGGSVIIDGRCVAKRGDKSRGYECEFPIPQYIFFGQRWYDVILTCLCDEDEFAWIDIFWGLQSIFSWAVGKGIDWIGVIKGKGYGLAADWPDISTYKGL